MSEKPRVVIIAGPAGSGKGTIIAELLKRIPEASMMTTATTRAPRPGEVEGVNKYFMDNARFKQEIENGNILEYYHREDTDTYYGTYKPDIDLRISRGELVLCDIQIVGAQYMKKLYSALTIFVEPGTIDELERRVRARAPISDVEWEERKKHTQRELTEDAPWYDYRVVNADGKLDVAVEAVMRILRDNHYIA